ncbi:uncharacterized protein LOC110728773 [Chenopodium quinoa]|uniref:uncharacterized protein LOC110728773 n=1 Tax=Chenopodium quinoa TaxID=63459 RepID=UPI000B780DF3|nr:uncharacterized protein LOC110728773 [Chenopodium quinoa]
MTLDKEWMKLTDRGSTGYLKGIDGFLDFAFTNTNANERCRNGTAIKFRVDLLKNGFLPCYTVWDKHGERHGDMILESENTFNDDDDMLDMLQVGCGVAVMGLLEDSNIDEAQEPSKEAAKFYRLLEYYKEPLVVDGKKVSKLVYIMKLLHLKCLNHWTDTSFTQLLKFQNETLGFYLPNSYDACRKIISELGLDYVKIDACPNDCIIYWRENSEAQECPKCKTSRWKAKGKNVPNKVLRYFPVKPRLQRLFMSSKTAKEIRWHKEERTNDDTMRHPADSPGWKSFDEEYKSFAADPRSVRLGLAADCWGLEKTKDNIKSRLDLVKIGIRQELHPIVDEDKVRIPVACYTQRGHEKSAFCEMFQNLRTPDGYCSNISRCVKDNGNCFGVF